MLLGIRTGVEQQIMTGNADVDGASANVDSDIERTQVEQLHVIVGILHNQLTRIAPQAIAASASMFHAGSDSMPLLGTAILSIFPPKKATPPMARPKTHRFL